MGVNATCLVSLQLTGDGLGAGGIPFLSVQTPTNGTALPPTIWTTANGAVSNEIPSVSGYAISGAILLPPPGSAIAKTLKGGDDDEGFPNWTTQPVIIPASTGQFITIVSTSIEVIQVAFF